MFGKNDSVKRRIFYAVVSVLHIISDTRGQTPVLTITANTVKIGSNFTVTCNVITNSVIQFFLNDNEEGYCPPPFLGQPCNPTDIKQDTTAAETSWTLPAETGYEGSWKCSRSSVNSTSVAVNMYNCPNTIISESGITTNVTLNDTATVTIKVKISCIYPAINPEISLQFMSSDSPSIPSTIMSCRQTTGTCSAGSAFECTQLISFDGTTLSSGSPTFEKEKSYSLNINVEPSTGTCDLLAIFESYRLIFETTGLKTSTEETSTTKQTTSSSSIISTASYHFTTIGTGKDSTVTVSVTSTDNQVSTNATEEYENKSLLEPLLISISCVSACLVLIVVVTLSVVYHKRHSNEPKTPVNNAGLSKQPGERHGYQFQGTYVPNSRDVEENNSNLQSRSKYNSYNNSHSKRDEKRQHDRYKNSNYRGYDRANEREQSVQMYLPNAYFRSTNIELSRQSRQLSIPSDYRVYHGNNRRVVDNLPL